MTKFLTAISAAALVLASGNPAEAVPKTYTISCLTITASDPIADVYGLMPNCCGILFWRFG